MSEQRTGPRHSRAAGIPAAAALALPDLVHLRPRHPADRSFALRGVASGTYGQREAMATTGVRRDPGGHPGDARMGAGALGGAGVAARAFLTPATGPRYSTAVLIVGGLAFLVALGVLLAECYGGA